MSGEERRDAANRLMDGITDLSDDLVLEAEEKTSAQSGKSDWKEHRWAVIGISIAAVLLAGFIALGIVLFRSDDGGRPQDTGRTEQGTEAAYQWTEAAIGTTDQMTEADTGAVTEALTETISMDTAAQAVTEEQLTESATWTPTETRPTEANPTEAGTNEAAPGEDARHEVVIADYDYYGSLEELEKDADVILRAVRLDQGKSVIEREGTHIYGAYTLSNVKISRIYKNTTGKLEEEQTITVLENEAYDAVLNTIYHVGGYRMMTYGNEYLLFLKHHVRGDGTEFYSSCGIKYGTIPTTDDGRDREGWEWEGYDLNQVMRIWNEARERYR